MDFNQAQGLMDQLGIHITWAYIIGTTLFGFVGMWAWWQGKRRANPRVLWIGVILTIYPIFTTDTKIVWGIGLLLCYLIREWW